MKALTPGSIIRRGAALVGSMAVLLLIWAWTAPASTNGGAVAFDEIPALNLPEVVGEEVAILTAPPFVPDPISRVHATRVIIDLEVIEEKVMMADGVEHEMWTFGGSVPGSFIRVREGDLVDFRLFSRSDSKIPHNIDLHAVTGPHGGGSATMTVPGGESNFTFRALQPGLYVYHCATAPVPEHVARGMYGLILVEPEEGLPEVDHEYYVVQGDFYTEGRHGEQGFQAFSHEKLYDERPDYVLFNGSVGGLMGEGALRAEVGETVRLFVGNGGPNLTSSFHVIGEIFDRVWIEGGSTLNHNVQTTMVPAGGAAIVDFRVDVPGTYLLVDHALGRVFNKGAVGSLVVTGEDRPDIFDASVSRTGSTAAATAPGQPTSAPTDGAASGPSAGEQAWRNVTANAQATSVTVPAETRAEGPNRIEVKMREDGVRMFFEPANVTVRPGDTVVFEQTGEMPHNVQFLQEGAPSGFDLGAAMMGPYLMQKGDTYEVQIDDRFGSGDHPFVCTPHVPLGMTGVMTVER